jgi:molybdopterin converting factor small subunit
MRVTVLHFAEMRELTGAHTDRLDLPQSSTVGDAWNELLLLHPGLKSLAIKPLPAVDHNFAPWDSRLHEGAILAFLTPMGGG